MATKLAVYTDTLLYPAILRNIHEAEDSIKIMMFVFKANSRTWEGGPVPTMDDVHPVRIVVFDTLGQSAASNEVTITLML